jgi:hypothetical protein
MNKNKQIALILIANITFFFRANAQVNSPTKSDLDLIAEDVKSETLRAWNAYVKYAWGHDELKPLSKHYSDWYVQSLGINLIDAYSTLKIMGDDRESKRIELYVADSISFDKNIFVKTFEVNIRILGGLLSMYELSKNQKILVKAEEFANRILPAFNSPSGLPYYFVNLKTGTTRGDTICAAEAGSYLLEMGILSYYTNNPKYYQIAKKSSRTIYENRTNIGLIGQNYNVLSGRSIDSISQVGCYVDSYYEYLYKGWLLFHDKELKAMWDSSITAINQYISFNDGGNLWYGIVNSVNGTLLSSNVTLWDAYFPALLQYSGDALRARKAYNSWHSLWKQNGLLPMEYDFKSNRITNNRYYLNPELIESTYYLWYFTNDQIFMDHLKEYYLNLKEYCRTDIAYTTIEDVRTKTKSDQLPTFFFAEVMKYFYLAFSQNPTVNLGTHIFTTEAHPFHIGNYDLNKIKARLGIR